MAAYNYFNATTQDLAEGVHNFKSGGGTYKVFLINSTAPVATNHLYGDISANEIATGNGYTTGGAAVTTSDSLSGSTETINGLSVTWTASGAGITFRYAVLYRSDDANKELVGWWDYGASTTITAGNQLTISWASGIATVTHS